MKRAGVGVLAAMAIALGLFATAQSQTAEATIHEGAVGSWCSLEPSGRFVQLIPPGLTPGDGKGPDSNVARPLFASGMFIVEVIGDDVYISINDDHPAVHTIGQGTYEEVEPHLFVEDFILDPEFSAFANCHFSPLGA